jgi:hypothetical protein
MNTYLLITAFLMIIAGIFSTTTSSMAIDCYNKNESFKKENDNNFIFLVVNLVCAILIILTGSSSIALAFQTR